MIYEVSHLTSYEYSAPVDLAQHVLHLRPRRFDYQRVLQTAIVTAPPATYVRDHLDHFGNEATVVAINGPHSDFSVKVRSVVDVSFPQIITPGPAWEELRAALMAPRSMDAVEASEFRHESPFAAQHASLTAYAGKSFAPGRPMVDAVRELTRRINEDFDYRPGTTAIATAPADALSRLEGVCQDFTHVMIAGLRGLGLAARYVSGYLRTLPPKGGGARRGADASHAWVSVWCGPDAGWIDVDPTNDLMLADEHIVVAWGRDFGDVSPVRGVILGGGAQNLSVAVEVKPVAPDAGTLVS